MHCRRIAALPLVLAVVTACAGSGSVELGLAAAPRATAPAADAIPAAAAIDAFGFDLLRRVTGPDENAVFSPASIAIALAMARAGARGETAAQMDAVLRSVASDDHASWLNALDRALASRSGTFKDSAAKDATVALRIANAPFAQRDLTLAPDYLDALAGRFAAGVRLVDYKADPEGARRTIDRWVADQTEGRIPELLAPGALDELTRLVLVNAIYLKAAWLTPFPEEATQPAPFTRLDGSTLDVSTMHGSLTLPYAEGDGWRAVQLPYVGGSLALTVIVPDDLRTFEAGLDGDGFASIALALEPTLVDLSVPKFGIETKADLGVVLAGLGMSLAFDPDRADFSGITVAEQLYIAAVVHQANIDVDEKGTEASAATAVVMGTTSMPTDSVTLRVDRPFLFALRDLETGAILFLGRVVEPSARR